MMTIVLRRLFLSAGVPEAQVDQAVQQFLIHDVVPPITSEAHYRIAKATYVAVDRSLQSDDINSPVARYTMQLGLQLSEWENAHPGLS